MGFYNNEILAIFKTLPEIQNNRYNPPAYLLNLKTLSSFCAFEKQTSCTLTCRFYSLVILWRWPAVTVFENFLEKTKPFQQKNYTTFIDSL